LLEPNAKPAHAMPGISRFYVIFFVTIRINAW
jgi:hypothetical protein